VLCLSGRGGIKKRFPLLEEMVIGRTEGLCIQLRDESVSRRHAMVECRSGRVALSDLGSANGTWVNGKRIDSRVDLRVGDRITLGSVSLTYEIERFPWLGSRTARLGVLAGGFLLLSSLLGLLWARSRRMHVAATPAASIGAYPREAQHCLDQVAAQPAEEMDWERAERVCSKALASQPDDAQVQAILKRLRREQEGSDAYAQGAQALERANLEEALASFFRIPPESQYFPRARSVLAPVKARIRKKAEEDCRDQMRRGLWASALPRCELYLKIACQEPGELPELALAADGYMAPPKDQTLSRFLEARKRVSPEAPPWKCPNIAILKPEGAAPTARAALQELLTARFDKPLVAEAVLMYWEGKATEALSILRAVGPGTVSAADETKAEGLKRDMAAAERLFKSGQAALKTASLEKVKEIFERVLKHDDRALMGYGGAHPSYFRRAASEQLALHAYRWGRHWSARKDARRACRAWKTGFAFFKGNVELNKAVQLCSAEAQVLWGRVSSCKQLDVIEDMAVEGDGIHQKLQGKRAAYRCHR
jgi:hypothetical protein